MRYGVAGIVFGLLAAACGGGDAGSGAPATSDPSATAATTEATPGSVEPRDPVDSATTSSSGSASTAPGGGGEPQVTTSAPASTDPAPAPATTLRPRPEGEDAPDFSLDLGQGGTFTLSAEAKPVYMVFWAEW